MSKSSKITDGIVMILAGAVLVYTAGYVCSLMPACLKTGINVLNVTMAIISAMNLAGALLVVAAGIMLLVSISNRGLEELVRKADIGALVLLALYIIYVVLALLTGAVSELAKVGIIYVVGILLSAAANLLLLKRDFNNSEDSSEDKYDVISSWLVTFSIIAGITVLCVFVINGNNSMENNKEISAEAGTDNTQETSVDNTAEAAADEMAKEDNKKEETGTPGFARFSAVGFDGKNYDASIFKGHRLTMINVWGTFCSPCIGEMPDLSELAGEYDPADFQLIGVCGDTLQGGQYIEGVISDAETIIEATGATYLNVMPSLEFAAEVLDNLQYYPTTFFVNEDGSILDMVVGSNSKEGWKTVIDEKLAGK